VVSLCSDDCSLRANPGQLFLRLAVGWEKLLAEEEDSFAISVWVKAWIHDERALLSREFHEST
jgi:hypothetical protein